MLLGGEGLGIARPFDHKGRTILEPGEHQGEQLVHVLTAMSARNRCMYMPPYPLDGDESRGGRGEEGQDEPVPPPLPGLGKPATGRAAGVVTDDVDFPIAQQVAAHSGAINSPLTLTRRTATNS